MSLNQAKDLVGKISDFNRLKSSAGATKDFETRAKSFSEAAAVLKSSKSVLDRLRASNIAPDFEPNDVAVLSSKARNLRDLIKADPANLNDPPFNLKYEFVDRINGLTSGASRAALLAWQRWVDKSSEMASGEVLSALGAVSQYKPVIARIEGLKRRVEGLRLSVPADVPVAIAELNAIMDLYGKAWNEMTGDGIPSSVVAFLRAAAGGGAPLEYLTDEIGSWLETRGLLTLFRIKI